MNVENTQGRVIQSLLLLLLLLDALNDKCYILYIKKNCFVR